MKLTIQSVPTSTSLILIPVMFESCIQSKNLTERDRVRERGAGEKILLIKKINLVDLQVKVKTLFLCC